MSSRFFSTKTRISLPLCTASTPSTISGQRKKVLSLGDGTPSRRRICRRLALSLQVSLSAAVRGNTDKLCSDSMQYRATAYWYMFPTSTQSSCADGLDSAHVSGENVWIRFSILKASVVKIFATCNESFFDTRKRMRLILIISWNSVVGYTWVVNEPSWYCDRLESSSSSSEGAMTRSGVGEHVSPMTPRLI